MTHRSGTLVLGMGLPIVWPPLMHELLYSGVHDGVKIVIKADVNGRLLFSAIDQGGESSFLTPSLQVSGATSLKIAFSWDELGARVAINGILLKSQDVCEDALLNMPVKDSYETYLREDFLFEIPTGLELFEERFLRFLIELQGRIKSNERVDFLEASAILRKLLLDAHPLVNRVNKKHRINIQFLVVSGVEWLDADYGATCDFIDLAPVTAESDAIELLNLKQFLNRTVILGGVDLTVRDVIDFCANTKGGVHFDVPKDIKSKSLDLVDSKHSMMSFDVSLCAIVGISWCVIQGLRPLALEVISSANGDAGVDV